MKYQSPTSNLRDIQAHLRNKNFAVIPAQVGVYGKILRRLQETLTALQLQMLVRNRASTQVVVSEQIVENPLILSNLREEDRTILDFGGFESLLPLQLSALGRKVTVVDQRKYPFEHPNLRVLCLDLFSGELQKQEQYDLVISVSTIEHLGLNHYGDSVQDEAGKLGVAILWDLVKPGGRLMVTVPGGKPVVQRGYRVYDAKMVREVFPYATSVRWFMKGSREGTWCEVEEAAVQNLEYSQPYAQMPTEAVVFVICNKAE